MAQNLQSLKIKYENGHKFSIVKANTQKSYDKIETSL